MPPAMSFKEQIALCAMSDEEVLSFTSDMAKVRLKGIIERLKAPSPADPAEEAGRLFAPDWTDAARLAVSGIDPGHVAGRSDPAHFYLHIDLAVAAPQSVLDVYVAMTGLSDKQRREVFPILSNPRRSKPDWSAFAAEVRRLNGWLDWVRGQGIDPAVFPQYHRHLAIHGASQNTGGQVGAYGAAVAFWDALREVAPGRVRDVSGAPPPDVPLSPLAVCDHLARGGGMLRAILLDTGRAVVFASDPDVAVFMPLGAPFASADEALAAYDAVRRQPAARRQRLHEFVVGEVKTATDRSNLHERLALGSRETRDEVRTDRFLMMSILTSDLLLGGTGQRSGRTLESRDVQRFSDIFNLYYAWGYDGGRSRHPDHWTMFKDRLALWCGV